ncbi:hypothetical protein [Vibrio rotiferianus]|uniref:hypothetical protein n=1 Tax=Vibrio rotiferianus TaxID=190895 RepID=UPI0005EE4767|nr:hypothetical protein [Vibrio rotiferianus]
MLKKNLAVSNEYFDVLYQPIVDIVQNSTAHLFQTRQETLDSYVSQLASIVRVTKGKVQEDNKEVHIDNFCAVLCFSAYFVADIVHKLSFFVDDGESNREEVHLWLSSYDGRDILVKKKKKLDPICMTLFLIGQRMLSEPRTITWLLGDKSRRLFDVLTFIHSGGERGKYSYCIDGSQVIAENVAVVASGSNSVIQDSVLDTSTEDSKSALDDLLGDCEIPSLDDLLNNATSSSGVPSSSKEAVSGTQEKELETVESAPSGGLLDELNSLLEAGQPKGADLELESEVSEEGVLAVSSVVTEIASPGNSKSIMFDEAESGLSEEMLNWMCLKLDNLSHGIGEGFYAVEVNGEPKVGFEVDKGVYSFIAAEYDLEVGQEEQVQQEILEDLVRSQILVMDENNFRLYSLEIDGVKKDNVVVTQKTYANVNNVYLNSI